MPFYGETSCQAVYASGKKRGSVCSNKAYYEQDEKFLCGMHSNKKVRTVLTKNPNASEARQKLIQARQVLVDQAAKENFLQNKKGAVICSQLKMMKSADHYDGFLKIFPNFKHGGRQDGLGLPELSPKALGPVHHGMSCLLPAKNLENYHQGAKIFPGELDSAGRVTRQAFNLRSEMYQDETPYRHKFDHPKFKNLITDKKPLCSLYYDSQHQERRYDYIECRYFYCHFYETLVKQTESFQKLKNLLKQGYNLQIVGYDGYPITNSTMDHYLDPTRPFGHELVLYCLLTIDSSEEYPWNLYYQKFADKYSDVI
jgi:hypothetical protein